MANETVGVNVNIKTNAQGSIAELKALKKQLKETAAGSDDFKRLANEIDDLEDKIKGAKQGAGDWVDQLAAAPGPLGAIGGALNKAKVSTVSFGTALKATGIGLFVAAIAGLITAFSESEKASKKLQPVLIGFQKIFNGIFAALEPVFDSLLAFAESALPAVTKGFGVAYSAITAFLQGVGLLGTAVKKLIGGDFSGAWDSAKEAVTGFGDRYEAANKRFIAGTQEVTKIEQEELDKRKAAQEKAAEEAKKRREQEAAEELKRTERQAEARRALLQNIVDKEAQKEEEERKKREEKFVKDQQKQLERTIIALQESRAALSNLTTANLQDARTQYIAQINAEAELSNETFKEELNRYNLTRDLQRQTLVEGKASKAELAAFDAETKKGEVERERASTETKLNIISGALSAIGDAVGRNTVAGKALAVAQASIDTYVGANKALSTYPPPFGAIAAGTVILSGLLNVKKIISTKIPPAPGSKGISDSVAAPSIAAPMIGGAPIAPPTPQAGTTNLTPETINQLGSATNRAYVVESDITNQQERITRINRAARLG